MLLEMGFGDESKSSVIKYYYRGLYVPEVDNVKLILYPGCAITAKHWAGNAEDILVVSRNRLNKDARSAVNKAITETADIALGQYIHYLHSLYFDTDSEACRQLDYDGLENDERQLHGLAMAVFLYRIRISVSNIMVAIADRFREWGDLYTDLKKRGYSMPSLRCYILSRDDPMPGEGSVDNDTAMQSNGKNSGIISKLSGLYTISEDDKYFDKAFTDLWFIKSSNIYWNEQRGYYCSDNRYWNEQHGYYWSGLPKDADFLLYDDCINTLFVEHLNLHVKKLYQIITKVPEIRNEVPDQKWSWAYQLSDASVNAISSDAETQNWMIADALNTGKEYLQNIKSADAPDIMEKHPMAAVLPGRPILPGFEIYRGLTVCTYPQKKEKCIDKKTMNVFFHLGCYFIWPFSFQQLQRIKEWVLEPVNEDYIKVKQDAEQKGISIMNEGRLFNDLLEKSLLKLRGIKVKVLKEQCREIADALSRDNRDYNTLVAFVAENLLSDSGASGRYSGMDYQQKSELEDKIRKQYESIIENELWGNIVDWIMRACKEKE